MWWLGVALAAVNSCQGAIADNLVRLSFVKERQKAASEQRPLIKRPLWLIGIVMIAVVDPLLTLGGLTFAAASMLSPFAGLHIFWNVLAAYFLTGESIGRADVIGSLVIIGGILLVVLYGPHGSGGFSRTDVVYLYTRPTFIIYAIVWGALVVVAVLGSQKIVEKWPRLKQFCVAASAALWGANVTIAAKTAIELVNAKEVAASAERGVEATNGATGNAAGFTAGMFLGLPGEFYIFVIAAVGSALGQLYFFNKGLSQFQAVFIVPTTMAFLIACRSVAGMVVLGERPMLPSLYGVGISLVLAGVVTLARSHARTAHGDDHAGEQRRVRMSTTASLSELANLTRTDSHDCTKRKGLAEEDGLYDEEELSTSQQTNGHGGMTPAKVLSMTSIDIDDPCPSDNDIHTGGAVAAHALTQHDTHSRSNRRDVASHSPMAGRETRHHTHHHRVLSIDIRRNHADGSCSDWEGGWPRPRLHDYGGICGPSSSLPNSPTMLGGERDCSPQSEGVRAKEEV
ncbi:unnamed protein product [Vitrella brassicaformis CCMP3155]|uniref:EamA domain-containing protein n=1 Tax=Vitrella brassicaformis (strain CCMP3155) TaxID=1169540 RepID=A0A0G4EGH2_VITBC|nr:unnamed protein product [Vitrella brassicaformis CCMP3155]|eukprot:CEL95331.1 unnamed protein product [Vitrella brassicaformis CCMP3155]